MYRSIKAAAALTVALSSAPVFAGEFDYNYLEAGWVQSKLESPDATGNGLGILGSAAITPYAHAYADFDDQNFGRGLHLRTYEIGAGFNRSVTEGLDLLGRASYVRAVAYDTGFPNITEDGWSVSMLLR